MADLLPPPCPMRGARLVLAPCGCTYYSEPLLAYLEFRAKGLQLPPTTYCKEHDTRAMQGSIERAREILRTHADGSHNG
jgi:hypothetical protein